MVSGVETSLLDMLGRLKLVAMRDRLDSLLDEATRRDLTLPETLLLLCQAEVARREERRIQMGLGIAKFPYVRTLESFDFAAQPSLDPKQVRELAACRWVGNGDTLTAQLLQLTTHNPPAPQAADPALPATLSDLVMRLLAKAPATLVPRATTHAPVKVATSTIRSGLSSDARTSASPSTSRPSASVFSTSTVLPPYMVSTSDGREAEPDGMFSAIAA